ncbi:MAG: YicC family protein [Beijerinckiaceae bacterium]|nr:YicC family protein [Beijerinckiaceae bacterium]
MTGFAREAGTAGSLTWAWELKSVNGRNLDVRVRVPPGFDAVGEEARKQVSAALTRGAVQVGLTVQQVDARRTSVRINTDVLMSLAEAIRTLPPALPFQPATMDGLLQVRGVVEVDDSDDQDLGAQLQPDLVAAVSRAASALALARRQEGAALNEVLRGQLARMRELVGQVEDHPARTVDAIRARLAGQVQALMDGQASLDPARLYQEAVLLATRADVREELDRLKAHIDASAALLAEGGAIGRKLDFLAQEFGREASTLCAKANHVELSRIGLELRALVDQFREQAQNVE